MTTELTAAEKISEILNNFSDTERKNILILLKENFCFYCGATHNGFGCECLWDK